MNLCCLAHEPMFICEVSSYQQKIKRTTMTKETRTDISCKTFARCNGVNEFFPSVRLNAKVQVFPDGQEKGDTQSALATLGNSLLSVENDIYMTLFHFVRVLLCSWWVLCEKLKDIKSLTFVLLAAIFGHFLCYRCVTALLVTHLVTQIGRFKPLQTG